MLPTAQPAPAYAITDTATAFRREGYTEDMDLDLDDQGGLVSFAPGHYQVQLELYAATDKSCTRALKTVIHHVGADPTVALMTLSVEELEPLRSDSYRRRVILTCPDGAVFVLVDGFLNLC